METLGARGIALKWPNDILLHGAKLGGILTELATDSSGAMSAVIGIGLNLRRSDACVPDVPIAALEDALRPVPDRSVLLGACAGQLAAMLETFASAGFAAYRQAWQARNAHVGCMVRVSGEMGAGREGLCVGVDDDGALLIETHGQAMRILSGDVTLRPA
jgi:BirA family biotin operon repressor/biotin-[acetyl-CoA-carboxylase] ligase